ncbi:unnamed protein product [Prunus armeniaca]|uniref:Uncharacterized protein n=1 Tax=Prunus armeniaca TaxID=36596 RepID=A0A6J5WEQ2_PRUAR|nr:unnamed protein product [Prunus armeniaca]
MCLGTTNVDDVEKQVDKFNDTDFELWKSQIIDYLNFKKLTAPSAGKEPDGMNKEDWKELDKMTLELLSLESRHVVQDGLEGRKYWIFCNLLFL